MTMVARTSGESVERLISRFRRQVIRKGTLKQARADMYYHDKPTRRIQKMRAIFREKRRKELEAGTLPM